MTYRMLSQIHQITSRSKYRSAHLSLHRLFTSKITTEAGQLKSPWKSVRNITLCAAAGFGLGIAVKANTDDGFARSLYFWRHAMPIYIHYRLTKLMVDKLPEEEQDAA